LFIGFEAVMTLLMVLVLFGLMIMLGGGDSTSSVLNPRAFKMLLIDYLFSTITIFSLAAIVAEVVQKKKYFRFRYEGERGVRALSTMVFYTSLITLFVPFYRLKV
ncbi:MAG: hypothetical protein ABEI52_06770, partial [Halobacteriaceae archaeon]